MAACTEVGWRSYQQWQLQPASAPACNLFGPCRSPAAARFPPCCVASLLLPSRCYQPALPGVGVPDVVCCSLAHMDMHTGYWNGSLVAVKVLEQVAGDFNPRSSLEPLLHHRLSHPNIVAMFDVCTQVGGDGRRGRGCRELLQVAWPPVCSDVALANGRLWCCPG
jgi:hypothetical protein